MASKFTVNRRELLLAVPLMLPAIAEAQEKKPDATLNLRRDDGLDKLLNQWREKEDIPAAYLAVLSGQVLWQCFWSTQTRCGCACHAQKSLPHRFSDQADDLYAYLTAGK